MQKAVTDQGNLLTWNGKRSDAGVPVHFTTDREGDLMLQIFVLILATGLFTSIRIVFGKRKLAEMDEHAGNAMRQIGMQLCDSCDVLMDLAVVAKQFDRNAGEALIERMGARQTEISAKSVPDDVLWQEDMMAGMLAEIAAVAEANPNMKALPAYAQSMAALVAMENMLRTSRMIYNDSVTKLNREIRKFPLNLIARLAGIRRREYLEERPGSGAGSRRGLENEPTVLR